jgi:hypothetical protein
MDRDVVFFSIWKHDIQIDGLGDDPIFPSSTVMLQTNLRHIALHALATSSNACA